MSENETTENTGDIVFDAIENAKPNDDDLIKLPLIRANNDVILPHTIVPLPLDSDKILNFEAAHFAIEKHQTAIYVNHHQDRQDKPLKEQFETIGTEIAIIDITKDESALFGIQGRRRVEIVGLVQETPFPIVTARIVEESIENINHLEKQKAIALDLFIDIAERGENINPDIEDYIHSIASVSELVDWLASVIALTTEERQGLLNERLIDVRFAKVVDYLEREIGAINVQDDVNNQVQDEINRLQREAYLREQMRVIQMELGEGDVFNSDLGQLRERILEAKLPEEAHKQALDELQRLGIMSPLAPEASVIRTYINWMLDIPWHTASKDNLNLRHAEKVLNREHYSLEKVKDRVLEHIAVRKMAGSDMKTPILCFVGPPGVGKTSLGKSIAEALGRKFVRVSLGGVRDEAEIRGHRRTYIGAMPGRIIQTIKRSGTVNPVFMLDEIDKMSEDYRGDPAAALLEVLDPEQNNEFADHYLEVPYDLSKVLFIATANELYPLPEALEDRMEIIEFRAYTEEEKLQIAKRFLIPKQLKAHGLARRGITFLDGALLHIIRHYTLEAGVRNLEREIANVCRKVTRLVAMRKKYPKRLTPKLVEKYLGPPYLIDSQLNREDSIGLVTGLVWTSGGGDIQIIEAALLPGKGSLTLTGSIGDVLQESAQIAYAYMRSQALDLSVSDDDFENYDIHLHMPEGAVPKDGPSAGVTLAIAIISAFTERKIRSDWAMTGEVTLRGHVLPVGGVKEKILAARRRGIMNVILPADNEKDLADIPKPALREMNLKFVRTMPEVMAIMLHDAPEFRERDALEDDSNPEDEN
ncbi:MAG: endopeptidase La [Anaerolineae bacterium]|nr:endopeptidase La [Anaerolineae bacterium]